MKGYVVAANEGDLVLFLTSGGDLSSNRAEAAVFDDLPTARDEARKLALDLVGTEIGVYQFDGERHRQVLRMVFNMEVVKED